MEKEKFDVEDDAMFLILILLIDGEEPDLYIISSSVWRQESKVLASHEYEGKSQGRITPSMSPGKIYRSWNPTGWKTCCRSSEARPNQKRKDGLSFLFRASAAFRPPQYPTMSPFSMA